MKRTAAHSYRSGTASGSSPVQIAYPSEKNRVVLIDFHWDKDPDQEYITMPDELLKKRDTDRYLFCLHAVEENGATTPGQRRMRRMTTITARGFAIGNCIMICQAAWTNLEWMP